MPAGSGGVLASGWGLGPDSGPRLTACGWGAQVSTLKLLPQLKKKKIKIKTFFVRFSNFSTQAPSVWPPQPMLRTRPEFVYIRAFIYYQQWSFFKKGKKQETTKQTHCGEVRCEPAAWAGDDPSCQVLGASHSAPHRAPLPGCQTGSEF